MVKNSDSIPEGEFNNLEASIEKLRTTKKSDLCAPLSDNPIHFYSVYVLQSPGITEFDACSKLYEQSLFHKLYSHIVDCPFCKKGYDLCIKRVRDVEDAINISLLGYSELELQLKRTLGIPDDAIKEMEEIKRIRKLADMSEEDFDNYIDIENSYSPLPSPNKERVRRHLKGKLPPDNETKSTENDE